MIEHLQALRAARRDRRISAGALEVGLALLVHYRDHKTGRCDPAMSTLAREAPYSRRELIRQLGELESAGLISRRRCPGGRSQYDWGCDQAVTGDHTVTGDQAVTGGVTTQSQGVWSSGHRGCDQAVTPSIYDDQILDQILDQTHEQTDTPTTELTVTERSKPDKSGKSASLAAQAREIWEHWRDTLKVQGARYGTAAETKIKARLKDYTVEELKRVPHGALLDDWIDRPKNSSAVTLFRDNEQVTKFINLASAPKPSNGYASDRSVVIPSLQERLRDVLELRAESGGQGIPPFPYPSWAVLDRCVEDLRAAVAAEELTRED